MNITLALLLTPLLFNCDPAISFQEMLDSAQVVVIGKVDSMWYSLDTFPPALINGKLCQRIWANTHVSAEILGLYAKNDSIPLPQSSIHIVYSGGKYPDGTFEEFSSAPTYKIGEEFLAAVEEDRFFHSMTNLIYSTPVYWKYTISGDSLWILDAALQSSKISIADAVSALSSHFIKVGQ